MSTNLKFVDASTAAGIKHSFLAPKTSLYSTKYWYTGGAAIEDFNGDGHLDIFVLGGSAGDKLYINNGDGTYEDQAQGWGVGDKHFGVAAMAADVNGDGWVDIYVTSMGPWSSTGNAVGRNRLYMNQNGAGFLEMAAAMGVAKVSQAHPCDFGAAFGDYDLDGDLDLFVATWCVGSQSADGNRLFRNEKGTFVDVTLQALGTTYPNVWGFQPMFADMDGDLYPEILLAADMGTSLYFVNNRDGTFTEATQAVGVTQYLWGMGHCVGDFDRNGHLDWYITSIFNPNGVLNPAVMHNGNALYLGIGPHQFVESSIPYQVYDGAWGWGASAADFDNDGWLDILEVNGRPSPPWSGHGARVFQNRRGTIFHEVAGASGLVDNDEGMTSLAFDGDLDGDLDALIVNNNGPTRFFRNETALQGHWLQIDLDGSTNPWIPPHGLGARVYVVTSDGEQQRLVTGDPTYLGGGPYRLHFGLGNSTQALQVRVRWSRGYETVLAHVPANQLISIAAPGLGDVDADGAVTATDVALIASHIGSPATWQILWADLDGDGWITQEDVALVQALMEQ